MKKQYFYIILIFLALLHLALLIPAFQDISRSIYIDSGNYLDLAQNLLHTGHYAGSSLNLDLVRPPVYPIFVAIGLVLSPGGQSIPLLQTLILFATAYLIYRIGIDLGNEIVGQAAIFLYLLNPNAAFWATAILTETLTAFWLVISLWMLIRFRRKNNYVYLVVSGIFLGLAALTRPIAYPLIFIITILLFFFWWFQRKEGINKFEVLKRVMIFLAAGMLLVIPWQTRNLVIHHEFTLSSVDVSTFQDWMVAKSIADMKGITRNEAINEIAASPDPLKYSLEFIAEHPGPFIKTQARGLFRVLIGAEYGTWAVMLGGQVITTTGMLTNFNLSTIWQTVSSGNIWVWAGIYGYLYDLVLYGLGLTAIILIYRRKDNNLLKSILLMLLVIIIYMAVIPGPAGESRFRVPIDPLLALFAGFAFYPLFQNRVLEVTNKHE